jgi:hypothetical protein
MFCYGYRFNFLYVDNIRTSQEKRQWASKICYGYGFTFEYADDVRTSQKPLMCLHGLLRGQLYYFTCRKHSRLAANI